MKKILLVGELNQTIGTVNKYLQTKFRTQICVDTLEMVKGMTKVIDPDMAVICLVGVGELDHKILDFFNNTRKRIPVLLIGTQEECKYFQKYYMDDKFDFLTRPTTLSELMEKCVNCFKQEERSEGEETVGEIAEEAEEIKKKILVVDDNGILLRSVKTMLADDYDVAFATDGMMALDKAKKWGPDLILLDYEMPKMDGKETLEELRKDEAMKNIPVVFLTGVAEKESIAAVLKLKPQGYLLKPIEQTRMMETIETVLEGSKEV